jgi:S1-C subfamily serine protease
MKQAFLSLLVMLVWFGIKIDVVSGQKSVSGVPLPVIDKNPVKSIETPKIPRKEDLSGPRSDIELSTLLMNSTFMLMGESKEKGRLSFGTGFVLCHPSKRNPEFNNYVLVTAAHVLESFEGQKAFIFLRKQKEDGSYEKGRFHFSIRDESGKSLWIHHPDPEIDVAVQLINLPTDAKFSLISTKLLGDAVIFAKYEIHPGDDLIALGFPLGVESPMGGFPILRSGKIASYPLSPLKKLKKILFDFQIYPGNSGGPVYFIQTNRYYGGVLHPEETIHFIVGMVSKQTLSPYYNNQPIYLAEIIPAQFIIETIGLLPEN